MKICKKENRLGTKRITALTWIFLLCFEMLGAESLDTVPSLGLARCPSTLLLPSDLSSLPQTPRNYPESVRKALGTLGVGRSLGGLILLGCT